MFRKASPVPYHSQRCLVSYGTMGHVDPKQIPRKGQPWTALLAQRFIHKVDLLLPAECYEALHQTLGEDLPQPSYSRVVMTLSQVLAGDFFTEYIKRGNILMISEGSATGENKFTLHEGALTMYLDKETYERAGLVGKPYGAKGNRGSKPRWIVSYDLRSPSMLHGKKGFDRLVYASKKVLTQPLTWLFCDVSKPSSSPAPLATFSPSHFTCSPGLTMAMETSAVELASLQSALANGDRSALEEIATDLYEWFSLVRLDSPRALAEDEIDPYLSRYQAPQSVEGRIRVCKLSWQGLLSKYWARELLVRILVACPSRSWFFLSATEFSSTRVGSSSEWSVFRPVGAVGEYLMWNIKSPE